MAAIHIGGISKVATLVVVLCLEPSDISTHILTLRILFSPPNGISIPLVSSFCVWVRGHLFHFLFRTNHHFLLVCEESIPKIVIGLFASRSRRCVRHFGGPRYPRPNQIPSTCLLCQPIPCMPFAFPSPLHFPPCTCVQKPGWHAHPMAFRHCWTPHLAAVESASSFLSCARCRITAGHTSSSFHLPHSTV